MRPEKPKSMKRPWYGRVTESDRDLFPGDRFLIFALMQVEQLSISSNSNLDKLGIPSTCLYASLIVCGDR